MAVTRSTRAADALWMDSAGCAATVGLSRACSTRRLAPLAQALAGTLLAVLAIAAPHASAGAPLNPAADGAYYAEAEVVSVSPRYGWREVSEPVEQCVYTGSTSLRHRQYRHDDYRHDDRHGGGRAAAGIVGGLIGGLVGNQFGGGDGRKALTVLGALLGASVARDHVDRRNETHSRYRDRRYEDSRHYHSRNSVHEHVSGPERRCTTTLDTRRERGLQGYDVTYRYQGVTLHKWMDEHPGDTVPVHVAVEPRGSGSRSESIH